MLAPLAQSQHSFLACHGQLSCAVHVLQSLSSNALIHPRSLTCTHSHGPQLAKFGSVTLGARVSNTIASKIIDVEIYQDEPGMCVRLLHSCITRLFFFARARLRLRARRSWPRRLAERTPSGKQLKWLCLVGWAVFVLSINKGSRLANAFESQAC